MFPKNSAFTPPPSTAAPQPISPSLQAHQKASQEASYKGPSRPELERWYDTLVDLLDRESNGDVDHTTELTDLRDDIYAYLY